jgi:hypothetical protein
MPEEISFDEASARIERNFLRRLATTAADDAVREVAGEIGAGRMRWSEAARSLAYGEALARMMAPVADDPDLLAPEAIAGWEADAHALIDTLDIAVDLPERAMESRIDRPS